MSAHFSTTATPQQQQLLQSIRIWTLCAANAGVPATIKAMEAHAVALRTGGDVHAALGAVLEIQGFVRATGCVEVWWRTEEAQVLWALGQQRLAVTLLDTLLTSDEGRTLPGEALFI
jgi:hypothetical protein